jgi:NADH-quinone oxidoreductase subunit L
VAMALIVRYTGSLSWSGIAANAHELLRPMTIWHIPMLEDSGGILGAIGAPVQVSVATLVGLSLFLGCAGKSAQFPLYVWLPDAMAGPTPVSALIHAATMVTAGVYLVCRLSPVFVLSPAALFVVAIIGAFTAILAATIALVQNDIKKVLAYSTVSQLGYMFIGVGVGAFSAGFFHVITHAFFKACLFLGAGSVIHAMHAKIHDVDASQDVRNMGGLRKYMPITHYTFLASCLAIAGFPLTSGFYSKDEILHKAFTAKVLPPPGSGGRMNSAQGAVEYFAWPEWTGTLLLTLGLIGAVMTAFYMFRLYFLTFWGDFRGWKPVAGFAPPALAGHGHDDHGHDHGDHDHGDHDDHAHHAHDPNAEGPEPHESPLPMYLPLVILGFLALVAGVLWTHPLEHWLAPVFKQVQGSLSFAEGGEIVQVLAIGAFAVGAGLALWIYYLQKGAPARAAAAAAPKLHQLLLDKWRVDEFYDEFIIGTFDFVADVCVWIDKWVVDGIVARLTAWVVAVAGHLLRLLQTGRVQAYAAVMMVGMALLGWFFTMPQPRAVVSGDQSSGRFTVSAAPGLGYAYRWDANADGKPDAEKFGNRTSVEVRVNAGESLDVTLEVQNAFGRVGSRTFTVSRPKAEDGMGASAPAPTGQKVARALTGQAEVVR